MSGKEELGVTIRTSLVMKDLAELIGCKDACLARLCVRQVVDRLKQLAEFVDGLKG